MDFFHKFPGKEIHSQKFKFLVIHKYCQKCFPWTIHYVAPRISLGNHVLCVSTIVAVIGSRHGKVAIFAIQEREKSADCERFK